MTFFSLASRVLVVLSCAGLSPGFAQTIDLVSGNDYAPYAGSKLKDGGLATTLVKAAFTQMGEGVTVSWMPWSEGYAEVNKGKFGATYPYAKTDARAADMLFSDPLITVQERLYVKAGSSKFDSLPVEEFAGSTLCLASGAAPHPQLAVLLESGKLKRVAPRNVSTCIELVHSGTADFFVLEERLGRAALLASGLLKSAVVLAGRAPLSETALYLVAPKNKDSSAGLIAKFNQGLLQLRQNGTYEQIVKAPSP